MFPRIPWRAHWFNYSLEGSSSADYMEVGLTYDYSTQQARNSTAWETRLQCVLGHIDEWPLGSGSSYQCDGRIPAAKLGAGLMSHLPEHYTTEDLAARLEIVEKLRLGGPLTSGWTWWATIGYLYLQTTLA